MKKEILYFSDILCVWAFISERRLVELRTEFLDRIKINYHFCSIFGSVDMKMKKSWGGDSLKYSEHVLKVAESFDHIKIHPDLWKKNVPTTSLNAHLVIKAVQAYMLINQDIKASTLDDVIYKIRESFFCELIDVSNLEVLLAIVDSFGIPSSEIETLLNNGEGLASLHHDLNLVSDYSVQGSPSFIMNDGRQKLYGNVGYHLIKSNIEEYLSEVNPDNASWC